MTLAETEREAARIACARERECGLAVEAARAMAEAESQLAQVETEKRRRADEAAAALREQVAMAKLALESVTVANDAGSLPTVEAVAEFSRMVSDPDAKRHVHRARSWRGWRNLTHPYRAAGAAAAAVILVATGWMGVQAPATSQVAEHVSVPAAVSLIDGATGATLKRSDTLASLDTLEVIGDHGSR